jgi:hypothetical protein
MTVADTGREKPIGEESDTRGREKAMAGGPGGAPVPGIGLPHNQKEITEFVKSRRLDLSLKVTVGFILLVLALIALLFLLK